MSQNTSIEWTDATWNPVRGCSMAPGSELGGCLNCYAARLASRNLPSHRSPTTGNPFAILTGSGPRWTGKVELIESKLLEPLRWRKPRRVFVNSMSDLFHENLPDESIDRVFVSMLLTPHITYQVLTKRARRLREYFWRDAAAVRSRWHAALLDPRVFPGDPRRAVLTRNRAGGTRAGIAQSIFKGWLSLQLPNVWLGVSIEDQPTAAARIPYLVETPAAVRFVSYEPALGPVNLRGWLRPVYGSGDYFSGVPGPGLDWVIAGGESGPGARPADPEWFRYIQQQCAAAGVPFYFKQWGGVQKAAGGALLDGREYKEFPRRPV